MRVLLANLKLFYQCLPLWGIYAFVAFFLILGSGPGLRMHPSWGSHQDAESTSFAWMSIVCAISLSVGAIVAALQMGVISAPLSFCLPDHRIVFRKLVFLVGLVVSLLVLSIEFAKDSPMNLSPPYLFAVSLVAYFAGVGIGLTSRYGLVGVTFGAVLLLPMSSILLGVKGSREFVVTTASTVVALLLEVSSSVAMWQWLGRTDLFRRRCGRPWFGVPNVWDSAVREKYRWMIASSCGRPVPSPQGDEFLLRTMRSCDYGSVGRHVWGTLYTWLLPGGGGRSRGVSMGLLSVVSAIFAWYVPSSGAAFLLNATIWPTWPIRHSPVHSSLLVAGGRRERFFAMLALIVILGCIVTCSSVLTFVVMDWLGVPNLWAKEYAEGRESYLHSIVTAPINLRFVILLMASVPVGHLVEIKLSGKGFRTNIAQGILYILACNVALFLRPLLMAIPLAFVLLTFILSWVVVIYGIHRIIMHSDLGRK